MKIKLKVSLSGLNFSYYEGQEIDMDEGIAKEWIKASYAEQISNLPNKRTKLEKGISKD